MRHREEPQLPAEGVHGLQKGQQGRLQFSTLFFGPGLRYPPMSHSQLQVFQNCKLERRKNLNGIVSRNLGGM